MAVLSMAGDPRLKISTAALENAKIQWRDTPDVTRWLLRDFLESALADGRYKVPVLQETAIELLALSRNPQASLSRIEQLIEGSPSLAAKLLSLANCPVYRGLEPFCSVRASLLRVGMQSVRDVLAQLVVGSQVFDVPEFRSRMIKLAEEGSGVAFTAAALARESGGGEDYAFVAGLLHDLGKAIVLQIITRAPEGVTAPSDALDALVETMHCNAGLEAARRMRLPEPIVRAIERHHDAPVEGDENAPALLVSLARRIWLRESHPEGQPWPEVEALDLLEYQIRFVSDQVDAARSRLVELSRSLGPAPRSAR